MCGDLKINMKTNVFTYFLISASSPPMPNNTAPSIPYAEILINNHIAETISIIPPVLALFFTYTDPTIPTMKARICLIGVLDSSLKLYPHFVQNIASSSFSVPQETQNFIFFFRLTSVGGYS